MTTFTVNGDTELIRELLESNNDDFHSISLLGLKILWENFSFVQAATWLVVNKESIDRFRIWIRSGDPDDAWS